MNILWMLVCACFVFFMQAGFTCYEAGFVQSKNVISVAIENMFNLSITIVVFSLVGFPLMFGETGSRFWLFQGLDGFGGTGKGYAFFFLQTMFAAVSVTIFAGALSERTKLAPLLIVGCVSAGFIYPVFGHWAWGGLLTGHPGWLEALGFMDLAGASVVHMTAGFIALAGLIVVGKRTKQHTGKSNVPLAVLGVFILWFGWFGFNGGGVGTDDPELPKVFLNTSLAAACGTLGALLVNLIVKRKGGYLISLFDGVLGGLVAITAISLYCSPPMAMALGFAAGIFADLSASLLEKLGIDDVVDVVPTHLVGGIIGCLGAPLCAGEAYLKAGGRIEQLGVQFIGVFVNFIWVFGLAYILFRLLNRLMGLRVTPEEEEKGLNIVEFSDIYSWENYVEISGYEREIQEKNRLLRKQSRLLAVTEEQEKEKLARDLHDGVGQSLSALKVILGMDRKQAEQSGDEGRMRAAKKATDLADLSLKEMRNVLHNLRPETLQRDGLEAGLSAMVETLDQIEGFSCELNIMDPLPVFDSTVELNLYRLVQEALTNVVKHAHANEASVLCRKSKSAGSYCFVVTDNGLGFVPEREKPGVGILSMRDRLDMLGGSFSLSSTEGKGTQIVMEVPWE